MLGIAKYFWAFLFNNNGSQAPSTALWLYCLENGMHWVFVGISVGPYSKDK